MKRATFVAAILLIGCSTLDGEIKTSFRDCQDCPVMVEIPTGTFVMGSSLEALQDAGTLEPFASFQTPQHTVVLSKRFAAGKYPVTRAEYHRFATTTNREPSKGCWSWNISAARYHLQPQLSWQDPGFPQAPHHPVVCVSWNDAKAYAAWLTMVTGQPYRLLSEIEREYATRASATTAWPWGSETESICRHANVSDLSRLAEHTATKRSSQTVFDCEDGFVYTSPVGSFTANQFGLYDTLGNVWEWVDDCFVESYADLPPDGHGTQAAECPQRTLRGGSWFTFTFLNRPAARYGAQPGDRSGHIGFRVARTM